MQQGRTQSKRNLTLGIVLTASIVLSGCGSGSDRADTVPERAATTTTPAPPTTLDTEGTATTMPEEVAETVDPPPEATTTTGAAPEETTPPEPRPAGKDPESIIITLDDLPTGWSPSPDVEDEPEDESSTSCLDTVFPDDDQPFFENQDVPSSEAIFQQSEFGPFLFTVVATDVEDGQRLFDDLGEKVSSCDGATDSDGTTYSILPVSFPSLGDDTFAVRMDLGSPEGFPASLMMAIARVDDVMILSMGFAIMGPADAQLVEDVTRIMVDRA